MRKRKTLIERINSLPKWARDYIMDLESMTGSADMVRRIAEQDDLIRQLVAKIAEVKGTKLRDHMPLGSQPGYYKK